MKKQKLSKAQNAAISALWAKATRPGYGPEIFVDFSPFPRPATRTLESLERKGCIELSWHRYGRGYIATARLAPELASELAHRDSRRKLNSMVNLTVV